MNATSFIKTNAIANVNNIVHVKRKMNKPYRWNPQAMFRSWLDAKKWMNYKDCWNSIYFWRCRNRKGWYVVEKKRK